MIEATWLSDVFKSVGLLYWLLTAGALIAAWKWGKGQIGKAVAALVVVCLFGYLPVTQGIRNHQADQFSAEAFARFNKYCAEKAGEKIYKKVEGVNSVLVMRPREQDKDGDYADQFWRGDPYGIGLVEDGEIRDLLIEDRGNSVTSDVRFGFQLVEVKKQSSSGQPELFEYRAYQKNIKRPDYGYELMSKLIEKRSSRYGFTWEDLSTDEDRKYWIAGSLLKVVDLDTNETVSERIGYMIDPGFGSTSGGRRPWMLAWRTSCPQLDRNTQSRQTRRFVIRSLNPSQKGE